MAYSTVPTVNTGDLWSAASQNVYLKDNMAVGVPGLYTTKGDIAVATANLAATRLGVGSNTQVLTADSGEASGVKWAATAPTITQQICSVYNNANISISNNPTPETKLTFNTDEYDPDDLHNTSTNTDRIVVDQTAFYVAIASIRWASNNSGVRQISIGINKGGGDIGLALKTQEGVSGFAQHMVSMSRPYELDSGDYFFLSVYQNSGGALNIERFAEYSPYFAIYKVN